MADTTFIGSALLARQCRDGMVELWEHWFFDDNGRPCLCEVQVLVGATAPLIITRPRAWFVNHYRAFITKTSIPKSWEPGLGYCYHDSDVAAWHTAVVVAWALEDDDGD